MQNNSPLVQSEINSSKNIFLCCFIVLIICVTFYILLKNRTVEIEKFSNDPVIYSSSGKTIFNNKKN